MPRYVHLAWEMRPGCFRLNHYRVEMDDWDPSVTDGLERGRKVILYDKRILGRL